MIAIIAPSSPTGYADCGWPELIMMISSAQLNRFERFLFRAAVLLGGLLILARIVAMVFLTVAS